ncbi:MAG: hypothetical protein ABSG59_25275 [Verrucomicrobiota bacterium]
MSFGMGPGDAELVTFQAAKLLKDAKDADGVFCFCHNHAPESQVGLSHIQICSSLRPCGLHYFAMRAGNRGMADLKVGVERPAEPVDAGLEFDLPGWRSRNVDGKLVHDQRA